MRPITIFWHRRDLRLDDNAGLYRALKESGTPVLPVFIFDTQILEQLEDKKDARVSFIHGELMRLHGELKELGSSIHIFHGKPLEVWQKILATYPVQAVYTNQDYEPYALERDAQVKILLQSQNIPFHSYKDHVIFHQDEVLKKDGKPYTVFTPYSKQWLKKLDTKISHYEDEKGSQHPISYYLKPYPNHQYQEHYFATPPLVYPTLEEIGFQVSEIEIPSKTVPQKRIKEYDTTRNFPAIEGTSKLGIHYRFGTISIRRKALKALRLNATYLNELIWRDFYAMILSHFPKVEHYAFKEKYEHIPWRNNEAEFEKWCQGQTGFPIVDAGMRELNATGYMHNRVRMITASFLTKHLLIDWRWGETYFAQKLLDFDLASNNGGWQWAAGCGTDAAPYFRIFNPYSQQEKFDKQFEYIKKWIPEYGTPNYVKPIVEHKVARERCLKTYKEALARD